jgi:transcriptional regulator of acetoin/glycerol metabolism
MKTFLHYKWPGNVRELENAIEHAFVLCGRDRIEIQDLPRNLQEQTQSLAKKPFGGTAYRARPKIQKEQLIQLLKECDWSKAEAARQLGVSHTAIWKYMKKWNIPLKFNDMK